MADRVVSVKLRADISDYTATLAKAAAATRTLAGDVDKSLKDVGPAAGRSGSNSGGLFAQGFRSGFVRNSPVIAAAIGASLAAGAPVALAGAGVLFAGIGALAAAQTMQVRSAFTALGHEIRDGAVADASVLVPVYEDMADKIGAAFQRMRPEIRDAFEAAAPQIERFTDGLTGAAENALPGLVRAIEAGGPVIDGLAVLMEDIGDGLAGFFDAMNDNSGAAGQALAGLGGTLEAALPLLGELLGTGAELAADVLPALGSTLSLVADVAHVLAPVLPAVVMGFVGFKAAQAAAGYLQTFAVQAQYAAIAATGSVGAGERLGGAMSKAADGIGKASAALPVLGIVLSGISSDMSDATSKEEAWAQAILAGGDASVAAYAQYQSGTHWGQSIDEATGLAASWNEAKTRADEMRDAMSPLEEAQLGVEVAQRLLNEAVDAHGASSPAAIAAVGAYETAQENLRRKEGEVELAIDGVTAAMIAQADQALAAIDSGFAYQHSLDQLEDAQLALNTAVAEHGPNSEEARRAQLALEEQNYRTALAFGQQKADLSGLKEGTAEYQRMVQTETLAELYRLRDAAGPQMKGAIDAQIQALEASGVKLDDNAGRARNARDRMAELGRSVTDLPGGKTIIIDANTGQALFEINALEEKIKSAGGRVIYTGANVRNVTGISARATGGIIHGPGTGTSDNILGIDRFSGAPTSWVSPGEFVVNKKATDENRGLIEAINAGRVSQRDLQYLAGGGRIEGSTTYHVAMSAAKLAELEKDWAAKAAPPASGPLGTGSLSGSWTSIFNAVKAAFPQARANSTYRPGDPGYHGRNKAVDFGFGSGPGGAGSAGLASINRFLHDRFGGSLAELIYDGIGDDRPDLKNGKPLTYNAATRAAHHNHVHAAVYHDGTDYVPKTGWAYLERGEAVIPARANPQSREFSGGGRSGGGGTVTVPAPQVTVHFHVDGQEFRGMTRTEIQNELGGIADALSARGVRA